MYKATLTQNKWLNSKTVVAVKTLKGIENGYSSIQEMLHVHILCIISAYFRLLWPG